MSTLNIYKWSAVILVSTTNTLAASIVFLQTRFRPSSLTFLPGRLRTTIIGFANAFSIGLFLAVCFLGLYASASSKINDLQSSLPSYSRLKHYPLAQALLCMAFLLFWLLQWCAQNFSSSRRQNTRLARGLRHEVQSTLVDYIGNENRSNFYSKEDEKFELLSLASDVECHGNENREAEIPLWSRQSPPENGEKVGPSHVGICHPSNGRSRDDNALAEPDLENQQDTELLKAIVLCFALGLHTVLEALGFSFLDSIDQVVSMAVAMCLHQFLCTSMLSLRLARMGRSRSSTILAIVLTSIYLILLPIGALVGTKFYAHHHRSNPTVPDKNNRTASANSSMIIPKVTYVEAPLTHQWSMAILQIFGAAAFMYILFVDLLPAEVKSSTLIKSARSTAKQHRLARLRGLGSIFSAFLGFLLIASLRLGIKHAHVPMN